MDDLWIILDYKKLQGNSWEKNGENPLRFWGKAGKNMTTYGKAWGKPGELFLEKNTFLRVIPTMTCQDISGRIFGHILNIF